MASKWNLRLCKNWCIRTLDRKYYTYTSSHQDKCIIVYPTKPSTSITNLSSSNTCSVRTPCNNGTHRLTTHRSWRKRGAGMWRFQLLRRSSIWIKISDSWPNHDWFFLNSKLMNKNRISSWIIKVRRNRTEMCQYWTWRNEVAKGEHQAQQRKRKRNRIGSKESPCI